MTLDDRAVIVLSPSDYRFVVVAGGDKYNKLYRSPDVTLSSVAAQLRVMADRIDPLQ